MLRRIASKRKHASKKAHDALYVCVCVCVCLMCVCVCVCVCLMCVSCVCRATCRVSGLCIRSHCGPCVLHRSGQLHLERCQLTCDAHGLEHLCAPIVTRARSAKTPLRPQRALSATVGTPAASATTPENSPLAQGGSQGGKLAVSECE